MTRSRIPITEEEHGGVACGEPVESVACNVDACDKPCVLEDWNEWSTCTKACDWGYQLRQRGVAEEAGPTGYCPESWDWDRLQAQWCAEFYCPPDLTCSEKMAWWCSSMAPARWSGSRGASRPRSTSRSTSSTSSSSGTTRPRRASCSSRGRRS